MKRTMKWAKSVNKSALLAGVLGLLVGLGGCTADAKPSATKYAFWPEAPEQPHVQFLRTIASTGDITTKQSAMDEVLYGKEFATELGFQRPYGVRMANGCIYICDATAGNVTMMDLRHNVVRIIGRIGQIVLRKPIDIAIAPDGTKYVADTGTGSVVIFDAKDKPIGQIATANMRPVSVAVFKDELYVADLTASFVRVFNRTTGNELRRIGEPGAGPGQFGGAMGLSVDKDGNVYVNDVVGCRVQKFGPDGKFILSFGGIGTGPSKFVRPKHMAVDSSGLVYVVDNAFANVQMFNDKGQFLMYFGGPGRHPGALDMPAGICVCETDTDLFASYVNPAFQIQRLVLVTNNYGPNKINVFALGELKPGKTLADIGSSRANVNIGLVRLGSSLTGPGEPGTEPSATEPSDTQPATREGPTSTSQPAAKEEAK